MYNNALSHHIQSCADPIKNLKPSSVALLKALRKVSQMSAVFERVLIDFYDIGISNVKLNLQL